MESSSRTAQRFDQKKIKAILHLQNMMKIEQDITALEREKAQKMEVRYPVHDICGKIGHLKTRLRKVKQIYTEENL